MAPESLKPDVILMDIRMPVMDGLEALRKILSDLSLEGIKVVMLTTFELDRVPIHPRRCVWEPAGSC